MKSRDFCYWLQGFFEIAAAQSTNLPLELNNSQVDMIKRHLNMVFLHEIDPSFGDKTEQDKLNKAHQTTTLRC